ncbi:hypothetical protein OAK38_07265 [Verrucomicrobia bacterium]|nr:hypothetical protein [Verrucomicrobiota bacterium]
MNCSSESDPSGPLNVACFATSHGFGHATRAVAVLQALARSRPGLDVHVFSTLPEWFWTENLSPKIPYRAHRLETDVGLVQKTPFEHDLAQTIARLGSFLAFEDQDLENARNVLRNSKTDLILCDVSPLGLALGKELGIPTVLVENFTWDWIYGGYLEADSRFVPNIERLEKLFRYADLRIQTEPLCERMQVHPLVPPIFREFEQSPERILARLDLPAGSRYLLVTTGGIPQEYSFLEQLKKRKDVHFVVTGSFSQLEREENLTLLPHRSGFHFPDLVKGSCGVVGKVGYGTVAETWGARVPLFAVYRDNFRESDRIRTFVEKNLPHMEATETDFLNGSWIDRIDELLALSSVGGENPTNGAKEAAQLIQGLLKSTPLNNR